MLMMLAAWGCRNPAAALAYNAGGLLQAQFVSPARAAEADDAGRVGPGVAADADDAGHVGLEKPWGGSCCFMMLVIFCCPRQRHLMVMMVAVWDLGCSWC